MTKRAMRVLAAAAMTVMLSASSAHAQDASEPPAPEVSAEVAAALFDGVAQSFDASLAPIIAAEAAAGDDAELRGQAYSDLAFWALMYARAVEGLDFPADVQPLADRFITAHTEYSAAADARVQEPSLGSLREVYFEAFLARQASTAALRTALGLPAAGAPSASEEPASSPSPAP